MVDDLHAGSAHHAHFDTGDGELTLQRETLLKVLLGLLGLLFFVVLFRLSRMEKAETERKKGN